MMRRAWSLEPNGRVHQDRVVKKWRTDADGKTGTVKASLRKDGKTVEFAVQCRTERAACPTRR